MSCIVNLRSDLLPDAPAGGSWSYVGFDDDCDGNVSGSTTTSPSGLSGDDPAVDFDGYDVGCYIFRYTVDNGPDCEAFEDVFVEVVDGADSGTGATVTLCDTDAAINIFAQLGGSPDTDGLWSGSGVASAGYNAGVAGDPTDDTFDPVAAGVGTYTFTYTTSVSSGSGITFADCANCNPDTANVVISVISCGGCSLSVGVSATVTVCNATGCSFDLFDQLGGTPDAGGEWTQISGPAVIDVSSMPVSFAGMPAGQYVFEYSLSNLDPNCDEVSTVTVNVLKAPSAGISGSLDLCESDGLVFLSTGLGGVVDTGGTWTGPSLPVGSVDLGLGTIDPAVGDAGTYVYTYTVQNAQLGPCAANCESSATVSVTIHAGCEAGANSAISICRVGTGTPNSIVLDAATQLTGADGGGTFFVFGQSPNCDGNYPQGTAFFSVNGGPVIDQMFETLDDGDTLSQFQNVGCVLLIYTCPSAFAACSENSFLILDIQDCSPACNSSVAIVENSCVIDYDTANPVNCPNGIVEVQIFSGGAWVPASGANDQLPYTGVDGNDYRVKLSNCPNCPDIFSNVVQASCPASSCTLTCSFIQYNTGTGELEFSWNLTGGSGSVNYFFNQSLSPNPSNCADSGPGWGVNEGNGSGGASGTATYAVAQTGADQCWRFVVQDSDGGCIAVCYGLIPASSGLSCYETGVNFGDTLIDITVDTGGGPTSIIGDPEFSCPEYDGESLGVSCSGVIQLVKEINDWISNNGQVGTASLWLGAGGKQAVIRWANVDFTVVSTESTIGGVVNATVISDPCTVCDPDDFHGQSYLLGESPGVITGTQCGSSGGPVNLISEIQAYMPSIPDDGLFGWQLGDAGCRGLPSAVVSGTIDIVNDPVDVNHGDLTWSGVECIPAGNDTCNWIGNYGVELQNGCDECFDFRMTFDETC